MDEHEKAITDYLTLLRNCVRSNGLPPEFAYAGIGDLFLQHARFYEPPEKVRRPLLTPKACFANSQFWAQQTGATYVEGYAMSVIPVHHAWCVKDGKTIEVTWEKPGLAYFGVEFAKVPKRFKGSMFDNGRDFDIYTKKMKAAER